jgi:hypothetical protein
VVVELLGREVADEPHVVRVDHEHHALPQRVVRAVLVHELALERRDDDQRVAHVLEHVALVGDRDVVLEHDELGRVHAGRRLGPGVPRERERDRGDSDGGENGPQGSTHDGRA